ncbi:phosphoribosyltransferase [Alkalilimnicola sp. S0819]|uniref:phosphoribosyltransferase n=1 Tax=Alkalilimnicola sp. S0819 TaxID=2613922 RepID=UPI0012618D1F|nr:phosphoribosyltransferase family protein [Alkalilimnicola sp. S0819]KAB7628448.1 phosphoribosyltransferase [Alkalilimnicola sp. S0819]MPQ15353.1 phosphoribosyltransferase [Alkalilimnicola sp. S0819]
MGLPYENRDAAGRALIRAVRERGWVRPDLLVYGLARGGVPVAAEIARALNVPLEVMLVRKLGAPGQEELAMGAIASGGFEVLNTELMGLLGVDEAALASLRRAQQRELARRERLYRGSRVPAQPAGRPVLLVDDGAATGASMAVAARALRGARAARVWLALPVAAQEALRRLEAEADGVLCLASPEPFLAVGAWYQDFRQTSDEQVRACLAASPGEPGGVS